MYCHCTFCIKGRDIGDFLEPSDTILCSSYSTTACFCCTSTSSEARLSWSILDHTVRTLILHKFLSRDFIWVKVIIREFPSLGNLDYSNDHHGHEFGSFVAKLGTVKSTPILVSRTSFEWVFTILYIYEPWTCIIIMYVGYHKWSKLLEVEIIYECSLNLVHYFL